MTKKVAIVTGGANGIGLAIGQELMEKGTQVVAVDLNQEALDKCSNEFELFDGQNVNVANEEQVKSLVNYVIETYGQIDYCFNVAAALKTAPVIEQDYEDWKFTVDIVLNSVFLFTKYVGQQMKKQGKGSIVNVASLNAHVPMYNGAAYTSAKAGVEMLTKNSALELAEHNVRVNAILPGFIATQLSTESMGNEEINRRFMERIPAKRPGKPSEVAKPAVFLASDDASYINGTSLVVDGGWEITGYPDTRI